MKIPDNKTAIKILRDYKTPVHIMRHCVMVAKVSTFLGIRLRERGCNISIGLLQAGGLLHDVAKYHAIIHGGDHASMGATFLEGLGYKDVAKIVRSHVHIDTNELCMRKINEAIVVNYADKRVKHTTVVSLEDRFEDLYIRYGTDNYRRKRIKELFDQTKEMEKNIFSVLHIEPDQLNEFFRRQRND